MKYWNNFWLYSCISGKVEMAATCGMVAVYDDFSLGVEMLIEGFKVGIWILGVP